MKNENKNIDTEFIDIVKENNNKSYIIVGILYVAIIILSVFLVLGIKNQKDVIKDNLKEEKVEESNMEEENSTTNAKEEQNNNETNDQNNLFEDVHSEVEQFNKNENEKIEDGMNLLDQIR